MKKNQLYVLLDTAKLILDSSETLYANKDLEPNVKRSLDVAVMEALRVTRGVVMMNVSEIEDDTE